MPEIGMKRGERKREDLKLAFFFMDFNSPVIFEALGPGRKRRKKGKGLASPFLFFVPPSIQKPKRPRF